MLPVDSVPLSRSRIRLTSLHLVVGLLLVTLAILFALAAPFLLWAYNVEKAGSLLEHGLLWPDPRYIDSLPTVGDAGALDEALGHLAAAVRWRPDHEHAHRLAGQVYLARGDWLRAAGAFELAREHAPHHPLLAWETGLAYEQMVEVLDGAPRIPLVDQLDDGAVMAPEVVLDTPYCGESPGSCYMGVTTFKQPISLLTDAPAVEVPTLFLHPPANVRDSLDIPEGRPALTFLLGLDPVAHEWGSDGATYRVWIEGADGTSTLAYERTIDGVTAKEGWIADWADLSKWDGQRVTLVLGVDAGPANDATGDWYGWGDVTLTTIDAAQIAVQFPAYHMLTTWRSVGFSPEQFRVRAAEAESQGRVEDAQRWYERAALLEDSGW